MFYVGPGTVKVWLGSSPGLGWGLGQLPLNSWNRYPRWLMTVNDHTQQALCSPRALMVQLESWGCLPGDSGQGRQDGNANTSACLCCVTMADVYWWSKSHGQSWVRSMDTTKGWDDLSWPHFVDSPILCKISQKHSIFEATRKNRNAKIPLYKNYLSEVL